MRKTGVVLDPTYQPTRPRWRPATTAWLAAALLAAPLAFDGAKIVATRWQSMYGPSTKAHTPALDLAHALIADVGRTTGRALTTWTHRVPWPVDYAAAGLVLCAIAGAYFLKRGRWS